MASNTITGTTSNKYISAKIEWSSKANTSDNSSVVTAKLYYMKSTASTEPTKGIINASITINGDKEPYNSGTSKTLPADGKWYYICQHEVTVTHNTDGSKSITISATGGMQGSSFSSTSLSGTATLDKIARAATIKSATDFTSSIGTPTITYSNPAGNNVTSLQACISLDGSSADVPYRDIPKTGTTYTFVLTDDEINTLKKATTGTSRTVKFFVKTVIGSNTYYSSLSKTFTINDDAPEISATIIDINNQTQTLTGNNTKLIKGFSSAKVTATVTADWGATIKSYKVVNSGYQSTAYTVTFNNVGSKTFTFTATDSRGNTTTKNINAGWVDYIKLTCNFSGKIDTNGTLTYTVKGNYFNSSFGAVTNTLTLKLKYGKSGDTLTTVTLSPTKSGNTYSYSGTVTGLDYRAQYEIYAEATDKLMVVNSAEAQVMGEPVFDWSGEDFNFNVPVTMQSELTVKDGIKSTGSVFFESGTEGIRGTNSQGTEVLALQPSNLSDNLVIGYGNFDTQVGATHIYGNKVGVFCNEGVYGQYLGVQPALKSGLSVYMQSGQKVELGGNNRLSKQLNGYILEWCLYLDGTRYAANVNYTYIPKAVLSSAMGGRVTSVLIAEDAVNIGAKSVLVKEDSIKTTIEGRSENSVAPNNKWVLSAVYGW